MAKIGVQSGFITGFRKVKSVELLNVKHSQIEIYST